MEEASQVQEVIPEQQIKQNENKQAEEKPKNYEQVSPTHQMNVLPQTSSPSTLGVSSLGFMLISGAWLIAIKIYKQKGIKRE